MIRKILFFVFAILTVVGIVFTVLCGVASIEEYERVSALPFEASGVDYLGAYLMKGYAVFLGGVSFFNALIALAFGIAAEWRPRSRDV